MSNESGLFYRIKDGKVSQMREVEVASTRLSDFLKGLAEQSPKELSTPPLPPNIVRYVKKPRNNGSFVEIYTVYSPPQMLTISYRARRHKLMIDDYRERYEEVTSLERFFDVNEINRYQNHGFWLDNRFAKLPALAANYQQWLLKNHPEAFKRAD